ncbi:glucan phosphoethanolaminetransferase (alkaline phosphatase superfamily) [Metabacillus crassostreae]|uniref:hypothetical protein n=1 Tax=Metabacillus crassostreae TaxID=929098 RepID=UPI001959377A|nr:hypothetical protein [Metabacillus crassostreae]MBM7604845.1 glucan phosphoethanolaminetransferase (alkaline phosphatase superfamily) [Metabacillus crassostreae]
MMKNVGFALSIGVWTLIALFFTGIDIPMPSSYIGLMIMTNAIFALFSIFVQRLVITLYEVNVFEESSSIADYFFKYIAVLSSGVNYYIQGVFSGLPFLVNKMAAIFFFVFLVVIGFGMISIFNQF